jgi:uncharacterized DUF497 family protein
MARAESSATCVSINGAGARFSESATRSARVSGLVTSFTGYREGLNEYSLVRDGRAGRPQSICVAYTIVMTVFDWDRHNLKKIKAHRLEATEVEAALSREPILIYEQEAGSEARYVYYGETEQGRLLAMVVTERDDKIRVITAYDLDSGQKRDYWVRRARGE